MATITRNDESLVERTEVLYPTTDVIDTEPHYNNFTAIQNALRYRDEQKQINMTPHSRSHSSDDQYRAVRAQVEPSSLRHYHSNEMLYVNTQPSSNTFTVPIDIQSKKIDGHIFNLIQIVEDIGYNKNTPFIRSSLNPNTKNVSALLNIILKLGGAHGPLVNVWRSRINNDYFQRWYLEKYYQRSASLIQHNTMNNINEETTQNRQTRDYQSNIIIDNFVETKLPIKQINNENHYQNTIKEIYGYDDIDATSSISSHSSFSEPELKTNQQRASSITSILKKNNNQNSPTKHRVTIRENYPTNDFNQTISSQPINDNNNNNQNLQAKPHVTIREHYPTNEFNQSVPLQPINDNNNNNTNQNLQTKPYVTIREHYPTNEFNPSVSSQQIHENNNNQNSQTKPHVTIREYYPTNEFNQSISSQQINDGNSNNRHILSDYQQFLHDHPDLYNDPNPEIITKPSPDHITYKQNISVRYLVPPTPPPPGPLIIREIVPPRAPSPPPLVITYQEPSPPTPPPLILREAPPPPPPHQETTVLTKILPSESQSSQRVIVERSAPLPPKPQSIIIEKWLPYKPAPPREVIYEHVTEKSAIAEFEPAAINVERARRHSAEFESNPSRVSIPVNIQRRNSDEYIEKGNITQQPTGTFDQLAWTTHQQILAMQQRGREQVQAHRQWAANQWQQHANMVLQYPTQLTTPSLVVYHQPVTTSYVQRQEYRQQQVQYNPTFVYPFF